jgi:Zn-dependent protease
MEFFAPIIIILVFSAVLHEIMHAAVANRLGDPTARLMGRLTLNPIPHLDPIMSVLVPAILILSNFPILFGAAKPVPVNPIHFKDPKKDMALTALAGPLTNFAIAAIAAQFVKFIPLDFYTQEIFLWVVRINLYLAFLNLVPIPPLDGSKVLAAFLPNDLVRSYLSIQQYGIFILLAFIFLYGRALSSLVALSMQLLGL